MYIPPESRVATALERIADTLEALKAQGRVNVYNITVENPEEIIKYDITYGGKNEQSS